MTVYVFTHRETLPSGTPLPAGEFIQYTPSRAMFQCKCGQRTVCLQSPPHRWEFDSEGRVSVFDSCLKPNLKCHFLLKDGVITMCSDAECPGAER